MAKYVRPSTAWSNIVIGALMIVGGIALYISILDDVKGAKQALADGQPAVVSLADFTKANDVHPGDEVHVSGKFVDRYTYRLVEVNRKRDTSHVRNMFVMLAENDPDDSNVARAVLLVDEVSLDMLEDQVPDLGALQSNGTLPVTIAGQSAWYPSHSDLADEALEKLGLTKGPEFVFIEPWEVSREADLREPIEILGIITGISVGLGVIGLLLMLWGLRQRRLSAQFMASLSDRERELLHKMVRDEKRKQLKKALIGIGVIAVLWFMFKR